MRNIDMINLQSALGDMQQIILQLNASPLEGQGKGKYGYVYRTHNKTNGKIYIGQRKGNFDSSYLGSGTRIKRSVKKYDKSNFSVIPIAYASSENHLNQLEIFFIAEYTKILGKEMMYNLSLGGESGSRGCKWTEEAKAKRSQQKGRVGYWRGKSRSEEFKKSVSLRMTGRIVTQETRDKISKKSKGRKHTDETKALISSMKKGKLLPYVEGRSSPMKGKKMTDEHKRKIGEANRGKKRSIEFKEAARLRSLGHPVSDATKEKHRQNRLGKPSPIKGIKQSEESKEKRRERLSENRLQSNLLCLKNEVLS